MLVELVFFCKQKTAYELRISDWSSDVCSSDRCGSAPRQRSHPRGPRSIWRPAPQRRPLRQSARCGLQRDAGPARGRPVARAGWRDCCADLKSVVHGKSVSVRVDLGGRRTIKTNNKKIIKNTD